MLPKGVQHYFPFHCLWLRTTDDFGTVDSAAQNLQNSYREDIQTPNDSCISFLPTYNPDASSTIDCYMELL